MSRTDPRRPRAVPEPTGAVRSARAGGLARRLAAGKAPVRAVSARSVRWHRAEGERVMRGGER
ncbi:hypothetical protein [Leucobacter massiliensis]|nr:hypothetical protein [Leucobacter massiliensis]